MNIIPNSVADIDRQLFPAEAGFGHGYLRSWVYTSPFTDKMYCVIFTRRGGNCAVHEYDMSRGFTAITSYIHGSPAGREETFKALLRVLLSP
jgi:hypothetical protein